MQRRTTPSSVYVVSALVVVLGAAVALLLNVLAGRTDLAALLGRHGLGSLSGLGLAAAALIVLVVIVSIYQLRASQPAGSIDFREDYLTEQRRQMLENLRSIIEDLLNLFPYNVRRIHVRLEIRRDAVRTLVPIREAGTERRLVPPGTRITAVFDEDARGMLLILGAPGSGKTTLLLELANDLLGRAKDGAGLRIPVLFFLSRWTPGATDLTRWLTDELIEVYKVPRALADYWVGNDQILPLLDGLDEVAADHRQACLQAVNDFRDAHGLLPVAVCSRLQDYELMAQRLQLSRAVVIQPLAEPEIRDYLRGARDSAAGLVDAIEIDPALMELLNTPLWLGFMMRALEGPGDWHPVKTGSLKLRRHRILTRCVDAMLSRSKPGDAFPERRARRIARHVRSIFRRHTPDGGYSREQLLRWLSWLSSSMARANRIPFYLEELDVDWLPTPSRRATVIWGARLVFGLVFGLIGGLVAGASASLLAGPHYRSVGWLVGGLSGALFGGLISFNDEKPADRLSWSFPEIDRWLIASAFLTGPLVAIAFWLGGQWLGGYAIGLAGSLLLGLCIGLGLVLLVSFVPREISARPSPNEGTFQSGLNGLFFGLGTGLSAGVLSALTRTFALDLGQWPVVLLSTTLLVGLVCFLLKGGGFFLSHWFIRLMLRFYGYAPLRYVRFLDFATSRLFLKRAGGGYLFAHRVLMEYFMSDDGARLEKRATATNGTPV